MPGASAEPLIGGQVSEWLRPAQRDADSGCPLDLRCWELILLASRDDCVPSAPSLLEKTEAPHEDGEHLVARLRRIVEDALDLNKQRTGVGHFYTVVKKLDHGPRSGYRKVLVDERIDDEFSERGL